jgi:hypothetical protein
MGSIDGNGRPTMKENNRPLKKSDAAAHLLEHLTEGRERPSGPSNTL